MSEQAMTDKQTVAEILDQHFDEGERDGPGAELMKLVWRHHPDAGKLEIHNAYVDIAQARWRSVP